MKPITVSWFEIPVTDMDRAAAFYEQVFQTKLSRQKLAEVDMAWFPWDEEGKGAGGTLIMEASYKPSEMGVMIYFSSENADEEISRVEGAGGKILVPKTEISPEIGYYAVFSDTEGNRISLHSKN